MAGHDEFSLDELDALDDLGGVQPESESEQWAEKALRLPAGVQASQGSGYAVFDIETGPMPWAAISPFYDAPASLAPFDESAVRYGNTTDPAKRAVKLAEAREKHSAMIASEQTDREAHKQEFLDNAAKSALTGRVLAIGVSDSDGKGGNTYILADNDDNESILLINWWERVSHWLANRVPVVGHCSNTFDWPFLIRRSRFLNLDVPREVMQGRFLNPLFRDTNDVWHFGRQGFIKLDTLAKFSGVGGKPDDCTGATFAKLWSGTAEERATAVAYLRNDIAMTVAVAKKLAVI